LTKTLRYDIIIIEIRKQAKRKGIFKMRNYTNVVYMLNEKEPDMTQEVIFWDCKGIVHQGTYMGEFFNMDTKRFDSVIAWMPNVNLKYMEETK
jgi:hypothetical protein